MQQFLHTIFRPLVFPAFDGHHKAFPFFLFKSLSGRWWNKTDNFKPGAFACFLSHAAIWTKVASGSCPYAFVFEDDVTFNFAGLEDCLTDIKQASFDLVFVNQRMHGWIPHQCSHGRTRCLVEVSPLLCERVLNGEYAERVPAPGADGYIVSKKGARKLLYMMTSRGINMGVDYAMVLNTLTQDQLNQLAQSDRLPPPVRALMHNELVLFSHEEPLCLGSFIYAPAYLANQPETFSSTILHKKLVSNDVFSSGFERRHMRWLSIRLAFLHWRIKRQSSRSSTTVSV